MLANCQGGFLHWQAHEASYVTVIPFFVSGFHELLGANGVDLVILDEVR